MSLAIVGSLKQRRVRVLLRFPRTARSINSLFSDQKSINGDVMKSIFVGNMSFRTTEADLTGLFQPFGQVGRIHIVTDRETGRARGFAFIEMHSDDEAARAIAALDGKPIGGRNLKVNEARPKANRPRGGGRSSHSGGGQGSGRGRGGFSNEDYRESARQPREPRW
jgi:cold-inducible RNA-binding protein